MTFRAINKQNKEAISNLALKGLPVNEFSLTKLLHNSLLISYLTPVIYMIYFQRLKPPWDKSYVMSCTDYIKHSLSSTINLSSIGQQRLEIRTTRLKRIITVQISQAEAVCVPTLQITRHGMPQYTDISAR